MDLFLIYLLIRFTRGNQVASLNDTILGRVVPNIVFINNQKLLKEACIKNLEFNSLQMMDLKAKAEANEFLYYKILESGMTARIDEDIGIEFTKLHRLT